MKTFNHIVPYGPNFKVWTSILKFVKCSLHASLRILSDDWACADRQLLHSDYNDNLLLDDCLIFQHWRFIWVRLLTTLSFSFRNSSLNVVVTSPSRFELNFVISPSELRDCNWSNMRHVICKKCCPVSSVQRHVPGEHGVNHVTPCICVDLLVRPQY